MKLFLKALTALFFLTLPAFSVAGGPVLWSFPYSSDLLTGLCFQGNACVISGALNPSSVAVDAPQGSLYISTLGTTYVKNDAGSTTNWSAFGTTTPLSFTSPLQNSGGTVSLLNVPVTLSGVPAVTRTYYVDGSRSDSYTADGSFSRPFKTIKAAEDVVSGGSTVNMFNIVVAPGRYTEATNFVLKPYAALISLNKETVKVSRSDNSPVVIAFTGDAGARIAISGMWFANGLTVDRTGATSASSGANVDLLETVIDGDFTYNGIGGGKDFFYARATRFNGNMTINAVESIILSSICATHTSTFGTTGGLVADGFGSMAFADIEDSYINALVLTAANGHDGYYQRFRTTVATSVSVSTTGTGTAEDNADVASMPETRASATLSGNGTLDLVTKAYALGYTPAVAGNWAGTAPNNVTDALDRMAALLKTLNANTPIP